MRILLGLGTGDDSIHTLERIARRATAAGDEVSIVVGGPGPVTSIEELEERVRAELSGLDVDAEIRTLGADEDLGGYLVETAEREGFDRIVLEGGARSPMGKIQLSSTAEFVLLNATTSVTLVR
ncbi:universal stress protein UspA [Halalkaliarchaeum desulfuricum]|uniref:Universal stress protein UspA n=1 Tax=Halalkaliarchaeum desulfuricum TaxID=2055893 RepID=A0A343TH65_9EURY|nr:universal stress protein [Halalkaliarchaeum desulfuricum]AUX08437.1 universal stress protein UspA [Halalkaliarchaeum desulfuricum]